MQGRDSRIEHIGDGNGMSDSARETQTRWHTCSGGSDRFQIQGQPGILTTVLSEKEKHTEECQDKVEAQSGERWRDLEPHCRHWDAAHPWGKALEGKQ